MNKNVKPSNSNMPTSQRIEDFCEAMGNMMDQGQGEQFLFSAMMQQFGNNAKPKLPKDKK